MCPRLPRDYGEFGASVVYHDVARLPESDERRIGVRFVPLDELLRTSDVVSLHVALTPATRGMIGHRELGLMKSTAVLRQYVSSRLGRRGSAVRCSEREPGLEEPASTCSSTSRLPLRTRSFPFPTWCAVPTTLVGRRTPRSVGIPTRLSEYCQDEPRSADRGRRPGRGADGMSVGCDKGRDATRAHAQPCSWMPAPGHSAVRVSSKSCGILTLGEPRR